MAHLLTSKYIDFFLDQVFINKELSNIMKRNVMYSYRILWYFRSQFTSEFTIVAVDVTRGEGDICFNSPPRSSHTNAEAESKEKHGVLDPDVVYLG